MQWRQVDFEDRVIMVGKAKTAAGTGRQIPMGDELVEVMKQHAQWFTKRVGQTLPEHYLFPAGERWPSDPTQPTGFIQDPMDQSAEAGRGEVQGS